MFRGKETGVSMGSKFPPQIVLHCDFGEDVDDPFATIVAGGLMQRGQLQLVAVTAGTDPVDARTSIGRGLMDRIGLYDVPVACGRGRQDEFWFESEVTPWTLPRHYAPAGRLLKEVYEASDDKSLTVVLCAPMRDYAEFAALEPDLFFSKTREVVIMGGVEMDGNVVKLDTDGLLVPDSARNNHVSPEAASYLYRELQKHGIPMVIVTRRAAYASVVTLPSFATLADSGNEVGTWLVSGLNRHFDEFWRNVNLPLDHPVRIERRIPERQNREWFIKNILKGKGAERTAEDTIHDLVPGVPLYDALAVGAACPEFMDRFFEPVAVEVNGTSHRIIGLTREQSGLKAASDVPGFMVEIAVATLRRAALAKRFRPACV